MINDERWRRGDVGDWGHGMDFAGWFGEWDVGGGRVCCEMI